MRTYITGFLAIGVLASWAALAQTQPPAEGRKPTSIFDFGGLTDDDDAPVAPPTIRERTPARKPVPAVVAPKPPAPVAPKPPVTDPAPSLPPAVEPPAIGDVVVKIQPVPAAADLGKVGATLDSQYPAINGGTPVAHLQRAGALIDAGESVSQTDPTSYYAHLTRAIDSAVAGKSVALVTQISERVVDRFAVDELSFRAEPLLKLAATVTGVAESHVLATRMIPLIEAAVREDDFVLAERLLTAAEQCAARATSRDVVTAQQVRALAGEVRTTKAAYQNVRTAMEAVAAGRATPKDLTAAGRYTALFKGHWSRGLEMLAACDDPKLKALAAQDLAATTAAAEPDRIAIADGWWNLSAAETGVTKLKAMERASEWYQLASVAAAGPGNDTAQARIAQVTAATRKLEPGLVAEAFFDSRWLHRRRIWVDPDVSANFSQTLPDPLLDRKHLTVRWTGYLKVPATGAYRFRLQGGGNDMVHLWINGRRVQRRMQKPQEVQLTQGFHRLRVVYGSGGENRFVNLFWNPPGDPKEQKVPAQYLFHDVRAGAEYVPDGGTAMLGDDLLDRTDTKGDQGPDLFDVLTPDPQGQLIGLRATTGIHEREPVIRAIQPIFRTSAGNHVATRFYCGKSNENHESKSPVGAVAREGYAVGAISVRTGSRVHAFKLHFMKVLPTGLLDAKDQYESDWIGGPGGKDLRQLGGDGRPVVGIVGGASENLGRIGLIMRGKTTTRPEQVLSARWGTGDKWDDVTNEVRLMVRNGDTRVIRGAAFKADPAPKKKKTLEVVYTADGERKTAKIGEGDRLILPGLLSN